jgi:hypothetical protein
MMGHFESRLDGTTLVVRMPMQSSVAAAQAHRRS